MEQPSSFKSLLPTHPFLRALLVSLGMATIIFLKSLQLHEGTLSSYPVFKMAVIVALGVIPAAVVGWLSRRANPPWSWFKIGVATFAVWMVMTLAAVVLKPVLSPSRQFADANEMMAFFAREATEWVKKDRNVQLDYSPASLKLIDEELQRISKAKEKPKRGAFVTALGYGGYVGEVMRKARGGEWMTDDPVRGKQSYPLRTGDGKTNFPVLWCYDGLMGTNTSVHEKAIDGGAPGL